MSIASTLGCSTGDLRLVSGYDMSSGRVETCLGGMWGTVCNIGWDDEDASCICQSLGFRTGCMFGSHDCVFSGTCIHQYNIYMHVKYNYKL